METESRTSLTISEPRREPVICNTTPVRHFAVVGQFDLLARILGGTVKVPRQVLDPDEDPDGVASLLSEIGQTERYLARRAREIERWSRLRALRQRHDLEVIDLTQDELGVFTEVQSRQFAQELGLAALGAGEAAVIAIASERSWAAVLDDAAARKALAHKSPATDVWTSRELLRCAAGQRYITSDAAESIYLEMREAGYRGPDSLWSP